MIRTAAAVVAGLAVIAGAFAAGIVVTRLIDDDDPAASAAPPSGDAQLAVDIDESFSGRVIVGRTDCSGDGSVVMQFLWTRSPLSQDLPHRVLVGPLEHEGNLERATDGVFRLSPRGQQKIGGLDSGRQYFVSVNVDKATDTWARSVVTTPSCDRIGGICPPSSDVLPQGPASGYTDQTSARIWVRTCYPASVHVAYRPVGVDVREAVTTPPQPMEPSADNTAVFTIDGLQPGVEYDYTVFVEGIAPEQPRGQFWTMPAANTSGTLRFVTASDFHQFLTQNRPQPRVTLNQMLVADPQFAVFLGDNIDVDGFGAFRPTSSEAYLRHYRDNWSLPPLRSFLAGVSTRMMWDDHDILNDWDKLEEAPYAFAKEAYDIFIGRQNPDPIQSGSTYFTFDAGDVSFFVLDCRSFRDKKNAPDDASKSMLGDQQKADLKAWLSSSPAKFKFIASTVQWSDHQVRPLRTNDAWDGFRTERQEIFDFIRDNGIDGVSLVSGDAHWPAVIEHPYGIIEYQTTPAGVSPPNAPESAVGAPDVLFYANQKNAFGLFVVDTTTSPARLNFTMQDGNGAVLFTFSRTEDELAQ
jgi:alkaline phosphatase D